MSLKFVYCSLFLFTSCVTQSVQYDVRSNINIKQAEIFFHTSFSEEDKVLISSLQKLLLSFEELSKANFNKTLELSKEVMYTSGLTPEIYKFSLKSYSIA
ncbi:MAG: hypothetical protein V4591_00135, partial [Bdellovibrionota bacterium]